ncbi:MAG: hypothetical protein COB02_04860 [Candidatus Cloacimonadota bacterium]|nr:MAG: hypothetical protein COB02_04860 [Candidatus Cloacimonadota bacterium]
MQKTERFFIFIILIVGALFLYILSIFMDFGGSQTNYNAPVIQEFEDSDIDLDDEDLDLSADARRHKVAKLIFSGNSYEPEEVVFESYQTNHFKTSSSALQKKILSKIKASEYPLELQERQLSKDLAKKGFTSPRYISMQIAALNKQPYKRHRYKIKQLEEKKEFTRALSLIETILKETSSDNFLLLGEIYRKAYELALQHGSVKLIDKYSKLYLQNTGTTLDIIRDSRYSDTHKGREKIYQLSQQLKKSKTGNIATLFAAIGSKQISSLGMLTALKANTKLNIKDAPFAISNQDIDQAINHSKSLFKNIKP